MSIAADASDALDPEVKRLNGEAGLLKERHDEATQATVDVQADVVLGRKLPQSHNVILTAVREVHGGSHELYTLLSTHSG